MDRVKMFCVIILCASFTTAQNQYTSEWYIQGGVGKTPLDFRFDQEEIKSSLGGNFGFGYKHFFSRYFGVSTGVEANLYQVDLKIGKISVAYADNPPSGLSGYFEFRADYYNFEEKLSLVYAQVPLMIDFQIGLTQSILFFLSVGGKIGFPIYANSAQTVQNITTTAYSEYVNQIYHDLPRQGYSTYQNISSTSKLYLQQSYIATLESGLKFHISEEGKNSLYLGAFIDYGLNDVLDRSKALSRMIEKNNETQSFDDYYRYNSIFQSRQNEDQSFAFSKFKTAILGIRLRFSFGNGSLLHKQPRLKPSLKPEDYPPRW
jgi:hypothetical protein